MTMTMTVTMGGSSTLVVGSTHIIARGVGVVGTGARGAGSSGGAGRSRSGRGSSSGSVVAADLLARGLLLLLLMDTNKRRTIISLY